MVIRWLIRRLTPVRGMAKPNMESKTMVDVSALRVNYSPTDVLDIDKLLTSDPIHLFKLWFDEARTCEKIEEPNAMTLATANKNGVPSARMVLLKGVGEDGFRFYTNYTSRKGCELTENPNAALLFYWEPLRRQVRIEGSVERLPAEVSDEYFGSRPHGSQLGARTSEQSKPLCSHQALLDKYSELQRQYPTEEHKVERPDHWGGFLIIPAAMEFWQGQSNRLHRRIQFTKGRQENVEADLVREGNNGWFYHILSS